MVLNRLLLKVVVEDVGLLIAQEMEERLNATPLNDGAFSYEAYHTLKYVVLKHAEFFAMCFAGVVGISYYYRCL